MDLIPLGIRFRNSKLASNKTDQIPIADFVVRNSVPYKIQHGRDLLVIPEAMQFNIVQDSFSKGHFSSKKQRKLFLKTFFIPCLSELVRTIVTNYVPHILTSRKSAKREGFLHRISKGEKPLDTYHCGFLGPLLSTKKNYKLHFYSGGHL